MGKLLKTHKNIHGKTALVTGSGRNLGKSIALELASKGINVIVNSQTNKDQANLVCEEILSHGVDSIAVIGDVGNPNDVEMIIEKSLSHFGKVDILINNAGLREHCGVSEITDSQWKNVLAVNLDAPFYFSRAFVPGMKSVNWGRIINISGLNAHRGQSGWAHVSASKTGAIGLMHALSVELSSHNILVNSIVPGAFDTSPENIITSKNHHPSRTQYIPLDRLGNPNELAKLCSFLISDDASYITGQTFHINGGEYRS